MEGSTIETITTQPEPGVVEGDDLGPFEIFAAVCAAAGIEPGAGRLGVLLALPEDVRHEIWAELAPRIELVHQEDDP